MNLPLVGGYHGTELAIKCPQAYPPPRARSLKRRAAAAAGGSGRQRQRADLDTSIAGRDILDETSLSATDS